jgi:putative CocE/NonD family hydrolase
MTASGSLRPMGLLTKALALAVATLGFAVADAQASVISMCNVSITMRDGTVLRANVFLPTTPGTYPTLLTVTGYNKDSENPTGTECDGQQGIVGDDPTFAEKGYAVMVLDDRGTGSSGGKWESWGQRTQEDYKEVLSWLQQQNWSNGNVAATGASYMGITSLLVAEADAARVREGKRRAVKVVWADVPMADAYRDVTFQGGSLDATFIPLWLGLTSALSALPPSSLSKDPRAAAETYLEHLLSNAEFAGTKVVGASLGEEAAYDGPFYRLRSPGVRAGEIKVPVVINGGWWDLFQRGEPLLWELLKRSPDRVLFMAPHYHSSSGPPPNLKREWFDHWLKGVENGVQNTPHVNLYPINGTHWESFKRFPLPGTKYQRVYLSGEASGSGGVSLHDGSLTSTAPGAEGGDLAPLLPASSPCSRETAQWTAGLGAAPPCETDNATYEASSLTYTTAPLAAGMKFSGLITADLWAKLSTTDATLVAVLSEVDPSGASNQITAGFLMASQRAIDPSLSTYTTYKRERLMIRPWHPFTKDSQQAVEVERPTEYRFEIYPTSVAVKPGNRLRLTIGTANTFSDVPSAPVLGQELGGTITLLHGGQYASNVLLPVPR